MDTLAVVTTNHPKSFDKTLKGIAHYLMQHISCLILSNKKYHTDVH